MNNLMQHLPILQVIVPLSIAVLCTMTKRGNLAWAMAVLSAGLSLAITVGLAQVLWAGPANVNYLFWRLVCAFNHRISPRCSEPIRSFHREYYRPLLLCFSLKVLFPLKSKNATSHGFTPCSYCVRQAFWVWS